MIEGWGQRRARRATAVVERDASAGHYRQLARRLLITHWGLWLALGLATALRLWNLPQSQFFDDQAGLMTLARESVLYRALPITGIPSSIGTLNPPLSIAILLPFALFTNNPMPSLVVLALWNVLGVALLYIFTLRYAGKATAIIASLLFACASAPVSYSRFLWQQNYLPPVLALWALTWQAALRSERRRLWLTAHVAALLVAILLHPTAALLAPITLVTLLLARNRPRRWEYLASAGIVALLLIPTVIQEIVSRGSDITVFVQYLTAPKKLDLEVFYRLYVALGAPVDQLGSLKPATGLLGQLRLLLSTPTAAIFTPGSLYATLGPLWVMCATVLFLLAILGWLVLTARVATPVISRLRATQDTIALPPIAARLRDLWRDLRTQHGWQQDLLLWLWVTLPTVLMLRHTGPVKPHYLMVLYPGIFVVMAQGIAWLHARATRAQHALARFGSFATLPASLVIVTFAVLLSGEVSQSAVVFEGIDLGQFSAAASHYGYLLSDMQAGDARIANFAHATGARSTTILLDPNFEKPLSYLLVAGHASSIGVEDTCLVLPPAISAPSLVVATRPASQSTQLLGALPNASLIGTIQMRGGKPFQVYTLRGRTPALLPGEKSMGGVPFGTTNTPNLRLDALAAVAPGLLRLRWTILQSTLAGELPLGFRILLRWRDASGQFTRPENFADCAPSRWQAGSTVFTWLRVPSASTSTLVMMLRRRIVTPALTTLGPVRLLAASVGHPPFTALQPQAPTSVLPSVKLTASDVELAAKAFGITGS